MTDLPMVFKKTRSQVHCGEEERFRQKRNERRCGVARSLLDMCARVCIERLLDWDHQACFHLVKTNDACKAQLYADMASIMNDALCMRAPPESVKARRSLLRAYIDQANDYAMVNSVPACATAQHMDSVLFAKQRHANGKLCSVIRGGQCQSFGLLDLSGTQVTDATLRLVVASGVSIDTLKLNRCKRVSGRGLLEFLNTYSASPQRGFRALNVSTLTSYLDDTEGSDELPTHLLGNLSARSRHLRKLSIRQNKQFTMRTICAIAPLVRQLDLRHLDIRGCIFTPAFQRRLTIQFEQCLCQLRAHYNKCLKVSSM